MQHYGIVNDYHLQLLFNDCYNRLGLKGGALEELRRNKLRNQSTKEVIQGKKLLDLFLADVESRREGREVLSNEEVARLKDEIDNGCFDSLEELVVANVGLVMSIAYKLVPAGRSKGAEFMDLLQEGNLGLLRAVKTFDPNKGYRFSTYATHWIRRFILTGLSKGAIVRLPQHVQDRLWRIAEFSYNYEQTNGQLPTNEQLAQELSLTVTQVEEALAGSAASSALLSLNSTLNENDEGSVLEIEGIVSSDFSFTEASDHKIDFFRTRVAIMQALDPEEYQVIELRFGLGDNQSHTYGEVANELGMKSEKVKRIEEKAIRKLRYKGLISNDSSSIKDLQGVSA